MRILELCFSDGRGGLELYAARASRELARKGHKVLCVGTEGTLFTQYCNDRQLLRPAKSLFARLKCYRTLYAAIRSFEPDVMHVHDRHDLTLAVLAKRSSPEPKPRLIYHRHTEVPNRNRRDAYHRFLYDTVDHYVTLSGEMRERALSTLPLPGDRITTLMHGVESPPSASSIKDAAKRVHTSRRRVHVGCFGRIDERKGQDRLIRAAGLLAERGVEMDVTLFGIRQNPDYFDRLSDLVDDLGLRDRVHYHGFVEQPQAYMACCDIVVHAASAEPFGLVVAEAMASGTAVVAANSGGVSEIVRSRKVGRLYPPEDVESLANHLQELIRKPELRRTVAKTGQAFAMEWFSEEAHYNRLQALFRGEPAASPQPGGAPD